ncbi:27442_t:CDS:2, partial [Racocetra persica]
IKGLANVFSFLIAMDKSNSTNISDSKDQTLKVENLSFEVCQELEKATHEVYVQNFSKNEVNDNTKANENLNNDNDPRNWSSKKKLLVLTIITICGTSPTVAPIFWAAYSDEFATRKKAFIASLLLFISASVVCAVATNIWLLTAMRAIQSCGSSAALPLSAGVISDIYDPL